MEKIEKDETERGGNQWRREGNEENEDEGETKKRRKSVRSLEFEKQNDEEAEKKNNRMKRKRNTIRRIGKVDFQKILRHIPEFHCSQVFLGCMKK